MTLWLVPNSTTVHAAFTELGTQNSEHHVLRVATGSLLPTGSQPARVHIPCILSGYTRVN